MLHSVGQDRFPSLHSRIFFGFGAALGIAQGLTACVSEKPPSGGAAAQAETRFVQIDPTQVRQLVIAQDDAVAGRTWVARLTLGSQGRWELASGPHGEPLRDALADSRWVAHFLDTLRTLQSEGEAPRGPMSSYGLDRPIFRVRWRQAGEQREREIRFGGEPGPKGTVFAEIEGKEGVWLARGAALRMLAGLENWHSLRERRLLTFPLDDIDEVLIERSGAKTLLFQRQGEFWADVNDRRFVGEKQDRIQRFMEALEHLRIDRFPDLEGSRSLAAPERRRATEPLVQGELRIRFKGRRGNEELLVLFLRRGQIFASVSSRPKLEFEIHPDASRWFAEASRLPRSAR